MTSIEYDSRDKFTPMDNNVTESSPAQLISNLAQLESVKPATSTPNTKRSKRRFRGPKDPAIGSASPRKRFAAMILVELFCRPITHVHSRGRGVSSQHTDTV